jgi:hypothetical protein
MRAPTVLGAPWPSGRTAPRPTLFRDSREGCRREISRPASRFQERAKGTEPGGDKAGASEPCGRGFQGAIRSADWSRIPQLLAGPAA